MASKATSSTVQHVQIRSDAGWAAIDFREILRHRDLLVTVAERDLKVRYKQTILGVVWVLLQPLMAALIFAFIFGVVARLPSNGKPYVLFAFAGLMAWNAFAQTLTRVSYSLLANAHMVSKVYFPRLILPLASVASTLIDFGVALALMFTLMAIYGVWPGPRLLLLPVWLAILLVMALGIGLSAAALMVQYRDIGQVIPVVLQLGMYVSPVAWSTVVVPQRFRWVFEVNPLSGLIEAFRWSLLGEGTLSWPALTYSSATAALVLWVGAMVFQRQERWFADVI
jgi:lipopolysaccharide transport system permease protein